MGKPSKACLYQLFFIALSGWAGPFWDEALKSQNFYKVCPKIKTQYWRETGIEDPLWRGHYDPNSGQNQNMCAIILQFLIYIEHPQFGYTQYYL